VLILHANDPDAVPLAYLSGAPHRYGWAESRMAFLLTIPVPTRRTGLHGLTEKIRNLHHLGIASDDEQMEFVLTDGERAAARDFLAAQRVELPHVCLHPFGSRLSRWWGGEREWLELACMVKGQLGLQLVLVGSAPEKVVTDLPGELVNAVNRLPLRASAALLASARAVISTDSGPLHLAQALAVPTLGLFGASLPEITGPRRTDAMILTGSVDCSPCSISHCVEQQCMRQLKPEKVTAALAELLCRSVR
jgi:ADP-heptose:LPS heptosyltransferase